MHHQGHVPHPEQAANKGSSLHWAYDFKKPCGKLKVASFSNILSATSCDYIVHIVDTQPLRIRTLMVSRTPLFSPPRDMAPQLVFRVYRRYVG